jgi:hypothetical protein
LADQILLQTANWNRTICSIGLCILPVFSVWYLLSTELPVKQEPVFGWVQVGVILDMHERSLRQTKVRDIPVLTKAIEQVSETNAADKEAITGDLKVRLVHPTEDMKPALEAWADVFVHVALVVESVALTIFLLAAVKILFVMSILISAQWPDPETTTQGLLKRWIPWRIPIVVDPEDPAKRFGVKYLDCAYNLALVLGLFAAMNYWFGQLSNLGKGTIHFSENVAPFFDGRRVMPIAFVAIVGSALLVPFVATWRHTERVRKRRLVAVGPDETARRNLIDDQRIWPGWKSRFATLSLLVFLCCVVWPLGLSTLEVFLGGDKYSKLVHEANGIIQRIFCLGH